MGEVEVEGVGGGGGGWGNGRLYVDVGIFGVNGYMKIGVIELYTILRLTCSY